MALSLGVQKGSKIRVGASLLEVMSVSYGVPLAAQILVDEQTFQITEAQSTEIIPGVFVSYGVNPRRVDVSPACRLAFQAPRSVEITRL